MKTVLLAPTPPPVGGIANWTLRMMNANLKNGWRVSVVDEKVIGGREVFGNGNKRNILIEIKRCLNIWRNLKKELNDPEAAVVHSCIPSATLSMLREYVCACITKRRKRKFIIHFRCTVPNTTQGKFANFVLKKLCNKSDMIFLLNQQSVDYLKPLTDTPIELIPNFIEENEIFESHHIKPQIENVLYVGGVIKTKGCADILDIARQFPEIKFKLIGRADEEIKNYARGLENVIFTGVKNKDEIHEEMKNADVFMFLSYFSGEGFSNALAEAMASGLPCIVTDWAANADMTEDKGGIVIPIQSPDMGVAALKKMSDPEIREQCSRFNIQKVRRSYSQETIVSRYVDCYEMVVRDN